VGGGVQTEKVLAKTQDSALLPEKEQEKKGGGRTRKKDRGGVN